MVCEEFQRLASIKSNLQLRSRVLTMVRDFFFQENFMETDTPLRVPVVAPEEFINPFNSEDWYLSTSPELQMKRLLSAGYDKIFQICHCFRKYERGRQHNPEFTMLEWYRAKADYSSVIQDTERLIAGLAMQMGFGHTLLYGDQKIDISLPWPRISVRDAYLQWAGWDPVNHFDGERFDSDMVDKIIPGFPPASPIILMDYPAPAASLARLKSADQAVAERAEIFIAGLEIANAYSELNDPVEQEQRFIREIENIQLQGKPARLPHKFLAAICHLPACAGIALGIDRLVMLLCNALSIDEVIAFPSDRL